MNANTRQLLMIGLAAAATLVAGCQSMPGRWNDDVRKSIDTSLQGAPAQEPAKPLPPEVSKGLLPPLEIAIPQGRKAPVEPRFDLSVANAPARQVFMGLVEGTPYDIVVHPDVEGTVTLNLKDVTVPEALRALREAYGYEFKRDGNRFFILGRGMQTRIFSVNYLNLQRHGKSDTRVKSGEIGTRTSGTSSSGTSTTEGVPSNIQVETESRTDFWRDLTEAVRTIIGSGGERRVVVNPQAGIVVVRALPEELRLVENYLGATESAVGRQVMLEAKIVEVQLDDRFQTGINWAKVHGNYTFGQVGGGSTGLATDGATSIAGAIGSLRPGTGTFNPASGTLSDAFGGVFTLAATTGDFTAFLELLKAQGEVQVLSSPRVSTVNNQKAVIKVGGEDFFVTGITGSGTTVVGTATTQLVPTVELTSFFSGIALDVTPQIDDANNIVLHIHPSVSAITEKDKTLTISGEPFVLPVASSAIQESDNVVRAQSGQIIVIGGLMKEASTNESASVPFLGDIPLIGNLFKHRRITRVKRELVILLKPTVIATAGEWNREVEDAQERIRRLRIGS